ncbi:hypothetical protein [Streptomyces huasconensis]|uniref:hypothetical protein n=1 Tax=Streptomyces huasconensis TaxID=1854574 RepID=UPI0033EC05C1
MTTASTTLLVVERAHRGAVETQFSDELYFAHALHRQSGGLDVLLRGPAAGYALDTDPLPAPTGSRGTALPLADPRRSLRTLLAEGAGVWVERADLAAFGAGAPARLVPGVRLATQEDEAPDWSAYDRIWFF